MSRKSGRERLIVLLHLQFWRCGLCLRPIHRFDEANIDHIIPTSRGGAPSAMHNQQATHIICNNIKGRGLWVSSCIKCGQLMRDGRSMRAHATHGCKRVLTKVQRLMLANRFVDDEHGLEYHRYSAKSVFNSRGANNGGVAEGLVAHPALRGLVLGEKVE